MFSQIYTSPVLPKSIIYLWRIQDSSLLWNMWIGINLKEVVDTKGALSEEHYCLLWNRCVVDCIIYILLNHLLYI